MTLKQQKFKQNRLENRFAESEFRHGKETRSFLKRYDLYTDRTLRKLRKIESPEFVEFAAEIRALMRQGYVVFNSVFKEFLKKFKGYKSPFEELYPSSGYCITVAYILKIASNNSENWEVMGLEDADENAKQIVNGTPVWDRGSHFYLYNNQHDIYIDLTGDQFNFISTIPYSKGKKIKVSTEKMKQDMRVRELTKYLKKDRAA